MFPGSPVGRSTRRSISASYRDTLHHCRWAQDLGSEPRKEKPSSQSRMPAGYSPESVDPDHPPAGMRSVSVEEMDGAIQREILELQRHCCHEPHYYGTTNGRPNWGCHRCGATLYPADECDPIG